MAFLQKGDIIIDAVLTTRGRQLLAAGRGLGIVKFAVGDDEIDYSLYDIDNAGGEAYYPLTILETPIMEANSDPESSMKSRLISLTRSDILYMPVLKLNRDSGSKIYTATNTFMVGVDKDSIDALATDNVLPDGILNGYQVGQGVNMIRIDQGIDNANEPTIPDWASESTYIIEMDNRLGRLAGPKGQQPVLADLSFLSDDSIATYSLSLGTDKQFISDLSIVKDSAGGFTPLAGGTGTRVEFRISANSILRTNDTLFNRLGTTGTVGSTAVKQIDSIISITGQNTGYRLDIPVRYFKKV